MKNIELIYYFEHCSPVEMGCEEKAPFKSLLGLRQVAFIFHVLYLVLKAFLC